MDIRIFTKFGIKRKRSKLKSESKKHNIMSIIVQQTFIYLSLANSCSITSAYTYGYSKTRKLKLLVYFPFIIRLHTNVNTKLILIKVHRHFNRNIFAKFTVKSLLILFLVFNFSAYSF